MPRHPNPVQPLTAEQKQLATDNLRLVWAGMRKYRTTLIDRDTMEAEFMMALVHAARTYNPTKGSFSGWAFWWFYNHYAQLLRDFNRRGIRGKITLVRDAYLEAPKDAACFEQMLQHSPRQQLLDGRNKKRLALDDMREQFAAHVVQLSSCQKTVLKRRMQGDSFREIGEDLGISKQRVEQVQKDAIRFIQGQLNGTL